MKKFEMFIGLNDKETKTQKITTKDGFLLVQYYIANNFAYGGSVSTLKGVYKHENGQVVIENSLKIELVLDSEEFEKVEAMKEYFTKAFNQESVLVISYGVKMAS